MMSWEKTPEWLATWNATIGSSRAPVIMHQSRFATELDMYLEMRGEKPLPPISPDMKRGCMLEPTARDMLGNHIGSRIRPHDQELFVRNAVMEFAHALPDGWASDGQPCELKVPRPARVAKIKLTGVIPQDYIIQCQHMLAICDCTRVHLGILCPLTMDFVYARIGRNDRMIDDLLVREAAFYSRMKRGIPPTDDWSVVPDVPDLSAPLVLDSQDAVDCAREHIRLKLLTEELDEAIEESRLRLIEAAGDNDAWEVHANGTPVLRCFHREQPGGEMVDAKLLKEIAPEVYEKVKRPRKGSRPFKSYVLKGGLCL